MNSYTDEQLLTYIRYTAKKLVDYSNDRLVRRGLAKISEAVEILEERGQDDNRETRESA